MTLLRLGKMLRDRRGSRGVREVAAEIGVSPATLSRVESGKLPDLLTFKKICSWLKVDPAKILELPADRSAETTEIDDVFAGAAAVHMRTEVTLTPEAANDLAQLILVAQRELTRRLRNG